MKAQDHIRSLRQFLTGFAASNLTDCLGSGISLEQQWLSDVDEGTLMLDLKDQRALSEVVGELQKHYSPDDLLSHREVERAVHQAMFAAADIRKKRGGDVSNRVSAAVRDVQSALEKKPTPYDCWVPVRGLDAASLPHLFSGYEFMVLDDHWVRSFRDLVHQRRGTDHDQSLDYVVELAGKSPEWGREVVKVKVDAVDPAAARELAKRRAAELIDVLNYFADLIPYHHGRAWLPGWASQEQTLSMELTADGALTSSHELTGPLSTYSFTRLREAEGLREALAAAEDLLDYQATRSPFDDRTVVSMSLAGRATIARRFEEAFLLYAIALEALLLPEGDREELLYRLALRTAFFLGSDADARRRIRGQVKDLYKIRSKIVHSGKYRVSKQELQHMRVLAKWCILRVLLTRDLRGLSEEHAAMWLEERFISCVAF